MTFIRLVKRSLCFYWPTNLGMLLTVVLSTAVLAGALLVGDSVSHSLMLTVKHRLADTKFALVGEDKYFREKLADELAQQLKAPVAPLLYAKGLILNHDGSKRLNSVDIYGVDERFYTLGAMENPFGQTPAESVVLNQPLAGKLGVTVTDEIVLRIAKPGLLPRNIALTSDLDLTFAARLKVKAVAGESAFGRFSLLANQISPLNVFVPLNWLNEKLGHPGRANMLLVGDNDNKDITAETVDSAFKKCWRLSDGSMEFRRLEKLNLLELRSRRIFIDESISQTAMTADKSAFGILTYFANELRLGQKATPYSFVAAISRSTDTAVTIIPWDMSDDQILINSWLADDLNAKIGDPIALTYYTVGSMGKLAEQTRIFRVRAILPIEGRGGDLSLAPDFPGLTKAENCRDWKPGIPIDLDKIRPRDEDYWRDYKATPKAFVTLGAGQSMWQNQYGNLTAVRYALHGNSQSNISAKLRTNLDPSSLGLFFRPVRSLAIKASDEATDFGQLFLGFSFFLIVAAVILTGLIFVFGVESRAGQMGMLKAVGFSPRLVTGLLLCEGCFLALIGAVAGTALGLFYTKVMIYCLTGVWRVAISGATITFHAQPITLFTAAVSGMIISTFAIYITSRRQLHLPARKLLGGNLEEQFFGKAKISKSVRGFLTAAIALLAAVFLLVVMRDAESEAAAGAFFGAGALLLIAGIGLTQAIFAIISGGLEKPSLTLFAQALRNSTRRSGRSLAVVAILACGVFLVVAVGANRRDPLAHAHRRDSGTGGFAFMGQSSIGILDDLNSTSGRRALGLDDNKLKGVDIVQLRLHEGDDAGCLNLNRAQQPRLLAVQPQLLQSRSAFSFIKTIKGSTIDDGWGLLGRDYGVDVIPAIGDSATITWALGKSIGDTIEYKDDRGKTFSILLVGMLANSIFQGSLIIPEDDFTQRFPAQEGYRVFLIDIAGEISQNVAQSLTRPLRDFGLELTSTKQRLADFYAVENTYLSIFQMLGGLGLILGSAGFALVVLRNILDRRGELAMLRAFGFAKHTLRRMVFYEHGGLMFCGLAIGVTAALVAVAPVLSSSPAQVPYLTIALTIIALSVSGVIWIYLATLFALKGNLLDALRSE